MDLNHLLKFIVSLRPSSTSFSLSDGNDREATSLCRQTTPIPASLVWRLWQATMNGSGNLGLRNRSFGQLVRASTKSNAA